MLTIQEFILDRNKSIETLNAELKKFIKDFSNKDELIEILNWISFKTKISKQSIISDTEIFVFRQFINARGKFNKAFEMKNILYDSIKLYYTLFIFVYSQKTIKK